MANENTRKLTIAGQIFTATDVYAAGHVVTENEARALNQTRAEALRNNFAAEVKKALGERETLPEAEFAELQKALDAYAAEYQFSGNVGGRTTDPLEREAKRIATEIVDGKIAEKGVSKAKYIEANGKDKYDALVGKVMATEAVQKEAETIVKRRAKLGNDIQF